MGKKILSIEIGQNITYVVEMEGSVSKPKVFHRFSFSTPPGTLDEGGVNESEEFIRELKSGMLRLGIKARHVVFTVSSGRIGNREITIPFVKEKRIAGMLKANAAEYFPVDLNKYQLVHRVIQTVEKEDGTGKGLKLVVLAIPIELIEDYKKLAVSCGLVLDTLDYMGNSIFSLMKSDNRSKTTVAIKIEDESTWLMVFKDGSIDMQRSFNYGIMELVEYFKEKHEEENYTYNQAFECLCREDWIHNQEDSGYEESLELMTGNLSRILDYYISRGSKPEIQDMILMGHGAKIAGLRELLSTESGREVTTMKQSINVTIMGTDNAQDDFCSYAGCIGAGMNPYRILKDEKINLFERTLGRGERMAVGVFILCILASLALLGISVTQRIQLSREVTVLKKEVADAQEEMTTYYNYLDLKVQFDEMTEVFASTNSVNNQINNFFGELEAKMPTSISMISLTAEQSGVTMEIQVESLDAAAVVLLQLRQLDTIENIHTSEVCKKDTDAESKQMQFTVTANYVPLEQE
ncbi:MAG: pilus assembly protein PilM [Lachnospiraceae bacterium]